MLIKGLLNLASLTIIFFITVCAELSKSGTDYINTNIVEQEQHRRITHVNKRRYSISPRRFVGAFLEHGRHFKGMFIAGSHIYDNDQLVRWRMRYALVEYKVDVISEGFTRNASEPLQDFVIWDTTQVSIQSNNTENASDSDAKGDAERICASSKQFQEQQTHMYVKAGVKGRWNYKDTSFLFPTPENSESEFGFLRLANFVEPRAVECFLLEELEYAEFYFRTSLQPPLFWLESNDSKAESLEMYNGRLDKVRQQLVELVQVHPLQILIEELISGPADFPKAIQVFNTTLWQYQIGIRGNKKQMRVLKSIMTGGHTADRRAIEQWRFSEGGRKSLKQYPPSTYGVVMAEEYIDTNRIYGLEVHSPKVRTRSAGRYVSHQEVHINKDEIENTEFWMTIPALHLGLQVDIFALFNRPELSRISETNRRVNAIIEKHFASSPRLIFDYVLYKSNGIWMWSDDILHEHMNVGAVMSDSQIAQLPTSKFLRFSKSTFMFNKEYPLDLLKVGFYQK